MFVQKGLFPTQSPSQTIHQQAQSIRIGQNAGKRDQAAITLIIGGFGADHPTRQQVCFRIHMVCRSAILTPPSPFRFGPIGAGLVWQRSSRR